MSMPRALGEADSAAVHRVAHRVFAKPIDVGGLLTYCETMLRPGE